MRLSAMVLTTFLSTVLAVSACSSPVDPDGMPEGPRARGVAAVMVNPMSASLPVGSVFSVEATPVDPQGQPMTGRRINWSSSSPLVASVSSSGEITALAPGEATVIASSEGRSGSTSVVVSPSSDVGSVRITTTATTVPLNGTLKLNVEVRDTANKVLSGREVSWRSSNANAAKVDNKGMVSGSAIGTATITAEADGKSSSLVLNVRAAEVASVAVQPGSSVLLVGETATLRTLLRDASGNTLSQRIVTWTSSNPAVATVSNSGSIVGQSLGTTTITATSEGKSGTASVTVAPHNSPDKVTVTPTSANLYPGDELQLQGNVVDSGNRVISGATIQWSSSNTGIARVSNAGLVTAVAPGSATITASSGGRSATAAMTVRTSPVTSITLSPGSLSLEEGRTATITATLRDSRGVVVTGRSISWTSSNTGIATVSGGTVTAHKQGSASITARVDNATSSISVSVVPGSLQPPPGGGGGAWPNRPSGYSLLTNRQFSSKASHKDDVVGAEGWSPLQEYNRSRISIVSDANAPVSPAGVTRYAYVVGDKSGTGHSRQDFPLPSPMTALHIGIAFKVSDTFWGHSGAGVVKQMYLWERRGTASHYWGVQGFDMGPLRHDFFVQGDNGVGRRMSPNVGDGTITRNKWHRIEFVLIGNTKACSNVRANGEVHIWTDGRKTHQYTDVCFDYAANSSWRQVNTTSIYGGAGHDVSQNFFTYWDHMQISGR
jgi:uncharacterized protein YjdB